MRIVSYNIRYAAEEDAENRLPHRIDNIIATIRRESPDLIGFQELFVDENYQRLREGLSLYSDFGYGRNADYSNETNKIFYRRDAFDLQFADQIWLSDTPRVPGSRFENQSSCPRVLVAVKLYHKASGHRFYMINTHLDHRSDDARDRGLRILFAAASRLKEEENLPVFITGDFNFDWHDPLYDRFSAAGFSDLTASVDYTFHGFMKADHFSRIDFILCDSPVKSTSGKWHEGVVPDVFLSDHDPVYADIEF